MGQFTNTNLMESAVSSFQKDKSTRESFPMANLMEKDAFMMLKEIY